MLDGHEGRAVDANAEGRPQSVTSTERAATHEHLGRHQRFVVDAKTEQRLAAKAQKAGLAERCCHGTRRVPTLACYQCGWPLTHTVKVQTAPPRWSRICAAAAAPRRRQGLRQGLRADPEDHNPNPGADADVSKIRLKKGRDEDPGSGSPSVDEAGSGSLRSSPPCAEGLTDVRATAPCQLGRRRHAVLQGTPATGRPGPVT